MLQKYLGMCHSDLWQTGWGRQLWMNRGLLSLRKVGEVLEAEGRESGISRGSKLWTTAALSKEQWVIACPSSLWAKIGRRAWHKHALFNAQGQWQSSKAIGLLRQPPNSKIYCLSIYLSVYTFCVCNLDTFFKYFPRSGSTESKDKACIILMLKKRCMPCYIT